MAGLTPIVTHFDWNVAVDHNGANPMGWVRLDGHLYAPALKCVQARGWVDVPDEEALEWYVPMTDPFWREPDVMAVMAKEAT